MTAHQIFMPDCKIIKYKISICRKSVRDALRSLDGNSDIIYYALSPREGLESATLLDPTYRAVLRPVVFQTWLFSSTVFELQALSGAMTSASASASGKPPRWYLSVPVEVPVPVYDHIRICIYRSGQVTAAAEGVRNTCIYAHHCE